jgi:phenylalanyl-tRNA synthetase beta chain
MPTIHVSKPYFFKLLGKTLTPKELEDLSFEFGIEFEVDETNAENFIFELPANRYDLLSAEGLALSLGLFLQLRPYPTYHILPTEHKQKMFVKPATAGIRPFVVAAILRNIKIDQETYDSFIDLQDKLHQNIGRKRTLVAIGTHDYDTIKGPFTYDAKAPKDIKFTPLNQKESFDGVKLMEFYKTDLKLKQYLHIIEDSPVYPVIQDSNGVVLSLPPIINGEHSKLKLTTKNILVECTANDHTKAKITLNTIIALFSQFCDPQLGVEEVEIIYEKDNTTEISPNISTRKVTCNVDYINSVIGIKIDAPKAVQLLGKMGCKSEQLNNENISVEVPMYRSDILHPCDIAEDVAIAYGYNNVVDVLPPSATLGSQIPLNKVSDLIRQEMAQAGYKECLNFALCSIEENSSLLLRELSSNVVKIANPKTTDFQVGRITLMAGLLKTLANNKLNKLPIHLFEVGDTVLKGDTETGAKNERHLAALQTHQDASGFEFIHGLLDHLMLKLNIKLDKEKGYSISEASDPSLFPKRQANIHYRGKIIGLFGIVHPKVLKNFEWPYPTSFIEIDIEHLINEAIITKFD